MSDAAAWVDITLRGTLVAGVVWVSVGLAYFVHGLRDHPEIIDKLESLRDASPKHYLVALALLFLVAATLGPLSLLEGIAYRMAALFYYAAAWWYRRKAARIARRFARWGLLPCPSCRATGVLDPTTRRERCPRCHGSGLIKPNNNEGPKP